MRYRVRVDEQELDLDIRKDPSGFRIIVADQSEHIDFVRLSPYSYSLIMGGRSHYLSLTVTTAGYRITIDQQSYLVRVRDETQLLMEKFGIDNRRNQNVIDIVAPIPGLVKHIFVKTGDRVSEKDQLLILEAMKMENEILAPTSGIVQAVKLQEGASKNKGDVLLQIKGGEL